jgi:hypothetical protein
VDLGYQKQPEKEPWYDLVLKCIPVDDFRLRCANIVASFIANTLSIGEVAGGRGVLIAQEGAVAGLDKNRASIKAALCEVDCSPCLNCGRQIQDDAKDDCPGKTFDAFHGHVQ